MVLDKKISIGHFVYTTIIALLIITFTLVFAFGGNRDAGNQVNVMATGISIILAVIAILMTLVDVAGQRQSIIDIKETADKLMENQKASDEALEKTIETLDFLSNFREEMLASVSEFKDMTEENLKQLLDKEKIEKDDLATVLKEIQSKTTQLDSKLKITPNNIINKSNPNIYKRWIMNNYPDRMNGSIKLTEFRDRLKQSYSHHIISHFIKFLDRNGFIYEENGIEYVDINSAREFE